MTRIAEGIGRANVEVRRRRGRGADAHLHGTDADEELRRVVRRIRRRTLAMERAHGGRKSLSVDERLDDLAARLQMLDEAVCEVKQLILASVATRTSDASPPEARCPCAGGGTRVMRPSRAVEDEDEAPWEPEVSWDEAMREMAQENLARPEKECAR